MSSNGADKFISRSRDIAARMLGGEMMIMAIRDSSLFSLNETATVIWQAADGITPLREIVEREIVARFEVDSETAYNDALELVEDLARHGILTIADQPAASTSP
jgi:hypothetical protein